jgi:arginine-tRNA-protein transferase
MPYCEGCQACVSVRVLVDEFEMTRSMRRVLDDNSDLMARRLQATPTSEQYSLFRAYIDARHADGGMADMTVLDYAMMVEDSIIDTFMTEYRLAPEPLAKNPAEKRPLMGVALCDRLSDGISMVYSFYEPEAQKRGLGTYMILEHIAYAKKLGVPYLYLGYWINGSPKMSYKRRFLPQEQLTGSGWTRV